MLSLQRTLSTGYWRRQRTRAGLVVAAIALGVATWVATGALNRSLEKASRQASTPLAGEADLHVGNGDAGVRRELAGLLAKVPGVRAVQPLVVQRVLLPELHGQSAILLGVDWAGPAGGERDWDVVPGDLTPQAYMKAVMLGQKPVFVGAELARSLAARQAGLQAGSPESTEPPEGVPFSVSVAGQVHRMRQAGTIEARGRAATLNGNVLVMECDAAGDLLGRTDIVSRLDLFLEPGADRDEVQRLAQAAVGGLAHVASPETHDQRVQEMLAGLKLGFALCGAAALVVGLFLVYNALSVSVAERRHDIGVLRALGATRGQVGALFTCEAAVLGMAGTAVGIPLGRGLAQLSVGPLQQILCDVFLPLNIRQLEVTAGTVIGAACAGMTATLLAALVPAAQAASVDVIDALRRVPALISRLFRGFQVGGSLGLAGLGVACLAFRSQIPGRLATFGSMTLIALAALLATPLFAAAAARLLRPVARRVLGVAGQLAADNLVLHPGRTGVVIAALAAGVALLLQTSGLIRSNEEAIRGWVDRSIAGDLFVTSGGPLSASGQTLPMPEVLGERMEAAFPGVKVVPMRFRYLDWCRDGKPTRILLLALDAQSYHAANKDRQPAIPDLDLYDRLDEPDTALVSENFAALHGVGPGDTLTLPGSDGPVTLHVAGTVVDYSCNRGTVVVDRAQFRRQFQADLVDVFNVYLPPGADPEPLRQRLQQSPVGAAHALCVLTRGEVRSHILGMVGRLYGLAYTQEFVVGIVAVLGVVAALLISVLQRRRELGLLRAVGATRAQVLRSVLAEAALMGLIGAAIGLLIGVPLEWYTVRVLLFEESGFLCPVLFPWGTAAVVVGLALGAALLAGLAPAFNAVRIDVVETLAYE